MILKEWSDCSRCERRTDPKSLSNLCDVVIGDGFESADMLLVVSCPPGGKELMDKLIQGATEGEKMLQDIYTTSIVGCHGWGSPIMAREVNQCRKRVFDIINRIDPIVIILSGELAAKRVSCVPAKKFNYKKVVNSGFQESTFPGTCVDVPRSYMVVPGISRLVENFSMRVGSDTHQTFVSLQRAFKLIETVKGIQK